MHGTRNFSTVGPCASVGVDRVVVDDAVGGSVVLGTAAIKCGSEVQEVRFTSCHTAISVFEGDSVGTDSCVLLDVKTGFHVLTRASNLQT